MRKDINRALINLEHATLDFESTKGLFKTILNMYLILNEGLSASDKWNKKVSKELADYDVKTQKSITEILKRLDSLEKQDDN